MDNTKQAQQAIADNKVEGLEDYKSVKYTQRHIKILMDNQAIPKGMSPQAWAEATDNGVILYDSLRGNKPELYIVSGEESVVLPRVVDTKGNEIVIEDLQKEFETQEYWNKELYKCRKSPVYYYTNYFSREKRPMQSDIDAYKEEIGWTDVSKEELEEVLDRHAATITLELLQTLQPVRDTLDEAYDAETQELLEKASTTLRYKVGNDAKAKGKIVANIVKRPIENLPADLEYYVLAAKTTGGKKSWDKKMLDATDLEILIRLWFMLK